ncbi:hypothetical protein [Pelagibacterium lacus]|uniref:Uncharacterized protein n=1 Tax=Pelagibacterium lacus TaxID=2282655 RepID=A0A369W7M9_9HYPH|nr:hypothetical protein [Pelagibacterium lacus]RDE10037.1 hypothetical protein DVH29_03655 [Pelagibacterium lacus]
MSAVQPLPTLLAEARDALSGVLMLVLGRAASGQWFETSQRGLAGSFIALILAHVLLAAFAGLGDAGRGQHSPSLQLFIAGVLVALRYGAMRLLLPRFGALGRFRAFMVASNWTQAIAISVLLIATFVCAFAGALLLGPQAGERIVTLVLLVWAAVAITALIAEINIARLMVDLDVAGIIQAFAAQGFALIGGIIFLALLL